MINLEFNGMLEYNKAGEYIVKSAFEEANLSKGLFELYMDKTAVRIIVTVNDKVVFNEEEYLQCEQFTNRVEGKVWKSNLYDYHVDGKNLVMCLFENVGEVVGIEIVGV